MPRTPLAAFALAVGLAAALPGQFVFTPTGLEHFPLDDLEVERTSLADFDGDGDLDAVASGLLGGAQRSRFYRNDGRGVFRIDAAWPDLLASRHLAADVDGDGDVDVLTTGLLTRNLGGGVLQTTASGLGGSLPLVCADFDGDGRGDVFATHGSTYGAELWRQTAAGAFVAAAVPTPDLWITAAAARDVDADGDLDLLLATNPRAIPFAPAWPGTDRVWRNDGTGTFTQAVMPGAANTETMAMAAADFDGDGDVDCALLEWTWPLLAWQLRRNDGTGNLVVATGHLPANTPNEPLRALDLDRDGDVDLVGHGRWLANDGTAHFTLRTFPALPMSATVTAHGDVDGDLDVDLVLVEGFHTQHLLLDDGAQQFVDASARAWPFHAPHVLGDLDEDGDLDALVAEPAAAGRIARNDGTGWFTPAPFPWPTDALSSIVLAADFDGDGDRDVLVQCDQSSNRYLRLLRNGGGGAFTDAGPAVPTISGYTMDAAVLDADGDGDHDVVLVVRQGGITLLANDGTGAFAPVPGAFPAYAGWLRTVAVGDLDGDGDTDVLTGDESYGAAPSLLRYFANGGGGQFTDVTAQRLVAPAALAHHLEVGDVDHDGDLDAFVACWGTPSYPTSVNLLLRNQGGTLTSVQAGLAGMLPSGVAALGDLDLDGDLDAVVGVYGVGVRLLANQGGASFVDVGGMLPPPATTSLLPLRLADADDDGDLDLFTADALFTNQHFGAFTPLLARTGHDLRLELRSRPGTALGAASAVPFFGLVPARQPLPPFGTLATAPGTAVFLPPVALTNGFGGASYALPDAPWLVGLPLVVQAVFAPAPQPHLSPALRPTLRD